MKRPLSALLLGFSLLALPACDASDDSNSTSINGTWELDGADELYVTFSGSSVAVHDFQGDAVDDGDDCYLTVSGTLTSKGGNTYVVNVFGQTSTSTIVRSGSKLTLTEDGETETFTRSNKTSFTPTCALT